MKKLLLGVLSLMAVTVFTFGGTAVGKLSAESADTPSEHPIQPPI
ncbi:hypothetical protein [Neobacillus terrae]|nr:hypothetical protein [Neobacillus terrae]